MKLATYNFQNIFYRHVDLVKSYRSDHKTEWKEEFESLRLRPIKTQKELNRLRELAVLIGFHNNPLFENVHLENIDGEVFYSPLNNNEIGKGNNIKNWTGWAKSKTIPIPTNAIINKSKVINDTNADILVVQEVESRIALIHFNKVYLKEAYSEVFFMEGNSAKNQGMGVLLKKGYDLSTFNSFANERGSDENLLFKNDIQLYCVKLPCGNSLFIINTLLNLEANLKRSKEQFKRISALVKMCSLTSKNIALVGTLGLPSYNKHIRKLIKKHSLHQISTHANFEVTLDKGSDASYYRLGAYTKGVNIKQQDYLMVSQELFHGLQGCGLNRKGIWSRKKPKWNTYKSMGNEMSMASEHPLLWSQFE